MDELNLFYLLDGCIFSRGLREILNLYHNANNDPSLHYLIYFIKYSSLPNYFFFSKYGPLRARYM